MVRWVITLGTLEVVKVAVSDVGRSALHGRSVQVQQDVMRI